MAWNKNALIRYRAIDKCLQNTSRRWTLNDLINACTEALYEHEGKDEVVSKRTVQLDLQMMRSDKLGYNAPIVVYDKKYYTYEDPNYSINNIPLNSVDLEVLQESVEILKQFKRFSLFNDLKDVINKLEDKIYRETGNEKAIIHFESNDQLKGLDHLDTLYQAIQQEIVVKIAYKAFKASEAQHFSFHGYILKEFNNRWFLIGKKEGEEALRNLALDRIEALELDLEKDYLRHEFDADEYYKNCYGITVLSEKDIIDIELKVDKENAPYVLTKPFHRSQELIELLEDGSAIIALKLYHNKELERLILGFGPGIEVLKPARLRNSIKSKFEEARKLYFDKGEQMSLF